MKKNKKRNAEVEALEEKSVGVNGKPTFTMDDIEDDGLTITKSEPAPLPRPQQPVRPVQQPQQNVRPMPAPQNEISLESAALKPVPGGLQPIIAPKGSVQLAPVVVPVAFVPYSTQNQPLLQYDKKFRPGPQPAQVAQPKLQEIKDQPLDKKAARAAKNKEEAPMFVADEENETVDVVKKSKSKHRAFSAILFILTLGFFAIIALNFFAGMLGIDNNNIITGEPNVINGWMNFSTENLIGQIPLFLVTAVCAIALATLIVEFVSICNGRGYHVWISYMLMTIIMLVVTMLSAFGILGESSIPLKPFVDGPSVSWLLTFASAVLMIFGLIFIPRKANFAENDDDDLSDLI